MLVVLGGVGNDSEHMSRVTDFDLVAEAECFVVACADRVSDTLGRRLLPTPRWAFGARRCHVPARRIDAVSADAVIDAAQVHVPGISAGAMTTYRLGCDGADRIAGVAAVAGAMMLAAGRPSRPGPVIHFHRTNGGLVPYLGGRSAGGATQPAPATTAVVERGAQLGGCPSPPIAHREAVDHRGRGGHTWFGAGLGPADYVDAEASSGALPCHD